MKMTKLDSVSAVPFLNYYLIPIKSDIGKLFEPGNIEFQISIKDEKLVIESPRILERLDFQDRQQVKEAINVN